MKWTLEVEAVELVRPDDELWTFNMLPFRPPYVAGSGGSGPERFGGWFQMHGVWYTARLYGRRSWPLGFHWDDEDGWLCLHALKRGDGFAMTRDGPPEFAGHREARMAMAEWYRSHK